MLPKIPQTAGQLLCGSVVLVVKVLGAVVDHGHDVGVVVLVVVVERVEEDAETDPLVARAPHRTFQAFSENKYLDKRFNLEIQEARILKKK